MAMVNAVTIAAVTIAAMAALLAQADRIGPKVLRATVVK